MSQVIYKTLPHSYGPTEAARLAWVARMLPACEATAKAIGITPLAIVAQAGLESGWGKAAIGNNVFGIKADPSWTGLKQLVHTREEKPNGESYYIDAWFRDYPTLEACIQDHFNFLNKNSRYRTAGVFDTKSDHEFFVALKRAGYATAGNYVEILDSVLSQVQGYRNRLERVELDPGYVVQPGGNVARVDPSASTIEASTGKAGVVQGAQVAAGTAVAVLGAANGMDWKVLAVLGVVVVAAGAAWYFTNKAGAARKRMTEQGIV